VNKEFITLGVIASALFIAAVSYTQPLHGYFINSLNGVKSYYFDTLEAIENTINDRINQTQTIRELKALNVNYQKDHLLLFSIASEYNALMHANNATPVSHTNVHLARAVSYAKFGDRNKMWLEIEDYNASSMYGLVINNKSAGIVIEHLGKPLALLNPDIKNSYAVYVGTHKAPGIVRGKNSKEMVVEFIPTWIPIHIGDEVKTSGLDKLFFEGILTGKVIAITQKQGYQIATITPYANTDSLGYFHAIEQLEE